MIDTATFAKVSADSHVNEPRDLWSANLPAALKEQAMRGIEAGDDGSWSLVLDGSHTSKSGQYEEERLAVLDPVHRFDVMRGEGIGAECIFPTIGLNVWRLDDAEGQRVSCRIYNEWILDQLASRSPRFCCAGLVPTGSVDHAMAEVRAVAEMGLGALMLPTVAVPDWNHKSWAPVWALAAETGLPVVMHQGTGHDMLFYRGPGATIANLLATQSIAPRTAALLATSGILERHPDLHVVFVEYNTGWLAWAMQTIDYYTAAFRRYGDGESSKMVPYPALSEPPSAYLRRQIHATFQDDPIGIANLAITGVDCLLWGSDYPHEEGTYPHSVETVGRLAAGLDDTAVRRIFRDTAADIFGFDRALLDTPF